VLDISGLTGASKAQTTQVNVFDAAPGACVAFRQWTGTVHCEGVHVGGDYALDGFQCQNSVGEAVLQMANCHSEPGFHVFHDDWVHPDGAQFYWGPTTARLERVDLISVGGNGFISQPREAGSLDVWRDWWLRDCHFRAVQDDTNGRAADASTSCFREDDYPAQSQNLSGQLWDVDGVFCSRGRRSDGAELTNDAETKYYYHAGVTRPAGIVIRARPPAGNFCDPASGGCGPGYVSPGYDGTVVPLLTKRPQA
jgi:hypothetical protein